MFLEVVIALTVCVFGSLLFSGFQGRTPRSSTLKKWLVYFAVLAVVGLTAGRSWSLLWALMPVFGLVAHFAWCFRHGIHPLSAEPRARYYALRGWSEASKQGD
jgi:hypothetical protein